MTRNLLKNYQAKLIDALNALDLNSIEVIANRISNLALGNTVFVAGNGGSATTASHMATDFGVGSLRRGKHLRVVSLADNIGVLTATANDLDFIESFSEQVKLLAKHGDLLILISASGQSNNLLSANETAKKMGLVTVSLTGFDGGKLKLQTDLNIHVETEIGEYGIVEDLHLMISHMITEYIRR